MKATANIEKNSDLRRIAEIKISKPVLIYLVIGLACVAAAFVFDMYKANSFSALNGAMNNLMGQHACFAVKNILRNDIEKYCNLVMTLNTILAAAVIFFYSIQDSRRGGIPNRTILAYTFGSFTIPVLFVITLFMLPFYYIVCTFGLYHTVYISLLFTYIIQIMIVIFILASTSYQYSVYAITNMEIRQFRALNELETENGQKDDEEKNRIPGLKAEHNPFFAWTYLQHNLEQVTRSNELAVDKLVIVRRILRVPYYQNEVKLKEKLSKTKISAEKMKSNNMKKLYEFYYGNLLAAFKCINQQDDLEYRNKMYLILYEFLEELTELYESELSGVKEEKKEKKKIKNNYITTVDGIINAVLSSNAAEAEGFCNYVFNNIISKDIWNEQIGLYILFQEYLYRTNGDAIKIKNIKGIEGIEEWKNDITVFQKLFESFWNIWMEYTTIMPDNAFRYFCEATRALTGKGNVASPVAYIMRIIGRKEEYICE